MAKEPESVGSDRAELKKLLKISKDRPVHMAFAMGADGKVVLQMHKLKPPRTLERDLKAGLEGGKNHRFGTVMVDPEFPKVAKFVVNKAVGGMARKIIVALKGTGFRKIQIVTETGESVEEAEGDDEDEEEEEHEGNEDPDTEELNVRPSIRPEDGEEATSRRFGAEDEINPEGGNETPTAYTNPDEAEQPRLDPDEDKNEDDSAEVLRLLKVDLTDLVKEMLGVIKRDPTAKTALAELATDAQASLKRGDVDQASAGIDILRQAIDSYSEQDGDEEEEEQQEGEDQTETPDAQDASDGNGQSKGANGKEGHASVQKFHKSRVAWTATRAKVDTELQKLSKAIMDASAGEDMVEGLEDQFFKVVDPVLAELDETLSDTLSAAADADGEERERLLDEARKTIARYTKFVESNSIISDLDNNPFVPLAIGKTLTGTLSTLTSIMK